MVIGLRFPAGGLSDQRVPRAQGCLQRTAAPHTAQADRPIESANHANPQAAPTPHGGDTNKRHPAKQPPSSKTASARHQQQRQKATTTRPTTAALQLHKTILYKTRTNGTCEHTHDAASSAIPPGRSDTVVTNRTRRMSAASPLSITRPSTGTSMFPPHSGITTFLPGQTTNPRALVAYGVSGERSAHAACGCATIHSTQQVAPPFRGLRKNNRCRGIRGNRAI